MADFDFLDGFDADGDWGFTSVKSKPATESKAESDATKEVVKQQQTVWARLCLVKSSID